MRFKINFKIPGYKRKLVLEAKKLHLVIPKGLNYKPWCGKQCQWLLREWQKAVHLPITGRFDDKTCYRLDHPPVGKKKITRRQHATQIALAEVGVHEEPMGTNRGPRVDQYIRAGEGEVVAEPWCADFVTWCEHGAGTPLPKFYYPGAFDWLDAARAKKGNLRTITIDELIEGDLVVWNFSHISRFIKHVDLPNGAGLETVDGNSGDQVAIRQRPIDLVLGCIRIV